MKSKSFTRGKLALLVDTESIYPLCLKMTSSHPSKGSKKSPQQFLFWELHRRFGKYIEISDKQLINFLSIGLKGETLRKGVSIESLSNSFWVIGENSPKLVRPVGTNKTIFLFKV